MLPHSPSPDSLPNLADAIRAEIASRLTRLAVTLDEPEYGESNGREVSYSLSEMLTHWQAKGALPLADSSGEHRLLRKLFPAGLSALDAYRELPDSPAVLLEQAMRKSSIVGNSSALRDVMAKALLLAATPARVLVSGETGTGKDVVARFIHEHSPRAKKPFIVVNCGALTPQLTLAELFGHEPHSFTGAAPRGRKGKVEAAHGGTLFLDEVADLSDVGQSALLRLLDQGEIQKVGAAHTQEVDVRVISASHRNLSDLVEQGKFREDLFYRLVVIELTMPPLRERGEDVLLLAAHYLNELRLQYGRSTPRGLAESAQELFVQSGWKGNVRQLKHVVEHAFIHAQDEWLDARHFPMLKTVQVFSGIQANLDFSALNVDITRILGTGNGGLAKFLAQMGAEWFTSSSVAEQIAMSDASARSKLRHLAEQEVLESTGERRGRRYRLAPRYILDFPPKNSDINSLGGLG